ncbi:hypothetical protein BH10PSE12_BH10PSE12_01600 [soil metagenome]
MLITGTDSAILSGRKAQLAAWKREFAAPDRTIYTRTCETVIASAIEPIALEQGRWEGINSATDTVLAAGIYAAKWRQVGEDWIIEGEIYVTLA